MSLPLKLRKMSYFCPTAGEEELGKDDEVVSVTIKAIGNILLNIESQSIFAYKKKKKKMHSIRTEERLKRNKLGKKKLVDVQQD